MRDIFRAKESPVCRSNWDGQIGEYLLYARWKCRASSRIVLDSHLDEIGFVVQNVTDNGFVKFLPLGGWWAHTLLAQRVTYHNEVRQSTRALSVQRHPTCSQDRVIRS